MMCLRLRWLGGNAHFGGATVPATIVSCLRHRAKNLHGLRPPEYYRAAERELAYLISRSWVYEWFSARPG
jgi:hypothetical protein